MPRALLTISSKTYSSWSLRAWFFLRHHGVPFDEKKIPFSEPDWRAQIRAISPNARVPLLIDGEEIVHDSKRIRQYLDWRYSPKATAPVDVA
jgi:glutathione S-transferase